VPYSPGRSTGGSATESREQWVEAQIPQWLRPVGVALFVYVFLGGVAFAVREDGQPRVVNGKFALTSHGRVVREVTEPEFHAAQRLEVRGASSAWMLFSAIPAAYFLVVYPRARRALAAPA
jgi:hypothetical protein